MNFHKKVLRSLGSKVNVIDLHWCVVGRKMFDGAYYKKPLSRERDGVIPNSTTFIEIFQLSTQSGSVLMS